MGLLKPAQSLDDLEEEKQLLQEKRSVLEEKVAIRGLEQKLGKGGWRLFSSNGKRSGFSVGRALAWLKAH